VVHSRSKPHHTREWPNLTKDLLFKSQAARLFGSIFDRWCIMHLTTKGQRAGAWGEGPSRRRQY
jgi:hypothetical protein